AIVTPDNQILVGGQSGSNFAIARYDIGGNLDTSFGANGIVNTNVGGFGGVEQLSTTADGKVLAIGAANFKVASTRYTATQPKVSVSSSIPTTGEVDNKAAS